MKGKTIRLLDRVLLEPRCEGYERGRTVWHPWPREFTRGHLDVVVEVERSEVEVTEQVTLVPQITEDKDIARALDPVCAVAPGWTYAVVMGVLGSAVRAEVSYPIRRRVRVTADFTPVSE